MRFGGEGRRSTGVGTAVLGLFLVASLLAPSQAVAQSSREPILLPVEGKAYAYTGRVPFRVGDDPAFADPAYDDSEWSTVEVPAFWHSEGMSKTDRVAWYRVHLRFPDRPPEGTAVLMPPTMAAWELYLGGRLIERSGEIGRGLDGLGHEAAIPVPLPRRNLRQGDNILALRVASVEGRGGVLGPLRFGTIEAVQLRQGRKNLVASGLLLVFLALTLFHLAVWSVSPTDQRTLLFALTMGCVALQALSNNDHWYLVADSTEAKLRLRWAARFAIHGFGVLFFAESITVEVLRPARTLAAASLVGVLLCLFGPFATAADLFGLSWILTVVTLLYAIDLTQGLPRTSPIIVSGVRAGLVGSMLALFYEVIGGIYELPGPGPFELGSLPLALALVGTVAMGAGLAHLRAARVVAASRDAIAVLKMDEGVELSNPALQRMVGRTPAQLRHDGIWPFLTPASTLELRQAVSRLRQGRSEAVEVLEVMVEAVGKMVTTEVVAVPLDSERVLLSFRDVTERQELEREVARAQRLDSLGMLAGGIAHDFNNLLAGVLASASELGPSSELTDRDQQRRVGSIIEAARRGGALTQRLLQFARGRPELPLGVDLEAALPDLVDMLGRTLGKNIDWEIDIESDLPRVAVDEGELEQVLVNLCVNARDAMAPRGGRIGVRARVLSGPAEEELLGLSVSDQGPGIPADVLEHVFEPFVTTKGSGAGTGLGLAVVYGIVKDRGGDVVIDTEMGRGTEVTLLLPIHEGTVSDSLPIEGIPAEPMPGLRVLLVDDEPALRTFLAGALRRRGMEVETLSDGRAAIEWARSSADGPPPADVVVMDMMMPIVDGLEATLVLREHFPGIPVVISSGYTGRDGIEPLHMSGPTMLLGKPYQVEELIAALARVTAPPLIDDPEETLA